MSTENKKEYLEYLDQDSHPSIKKEKKRGHPRFNKRGKKRLNGVENGSLR